MTSTDKVISVLDDAGTPKVKDGEKVVQDMKDGIEKAKSAHLKARKGLKPLDTDNKEAFYQDSENIHSQLGKDFAEINNNPDRTTSPELDKLLSDEASCRTS